ncbi:AGCS family alanine or glycine:cation symporter [Sinorhizobium fredii]|uniref:Putative sodium/glutamine symporter GlnT n=1 Tax=Sinorhizobium fredii (strain USDA 257) TaxID=1185652 RepID=I3X5T5_SINF2|nr:alanine/glycine:cation symporter family protein [Sinorhizobium fredii]AFL51241.1 putative sodium/glutamine symporter GlnT [Sinorhizobium fredii USDA 257]
MLDFLNDLLWSKVLIVVLIGIGLWFTLASRFVQLRYFGRMFRILGSGQAFARGSDGHLSSFQALMLSVAGRVGGGNIAGVAVAITLGGPGAIFWMWLVGLIGMATSFFECTLAQAYKRAEPDGTYRGGPAYYIARGLGERWKWLAGVYSVLLLVTFGFGFNGVQSYSVATSLNDAFGLPVIATGAGIAVLVGIIIAGGVRRIARIADVLVPVMALSYIAIALVVLAFNIDALPATLMLIVKSAFGLEPAIGGGIGAAIVMGVRRGLFSNEAGLGSAPNVAAVAQVPHPASQGVVQAFSVFIDTLIVCSCTAFIILLGDVYRPGADEMVGVALAQASLASHIGEWGRVFVSIAMMLFGFTTMIYNYYLGENSLVWFGGRNKPLIILYRMAVVGLCGWGATSDLGTIFAFADVTMGLLALVNLLALVMLFKPALKLMRDYDRQLVQGASEPVFNPEKFGYPGIDRDAWKGEAWGYEPEGAVAASGSARV